MVPVPSDRQENQLYDLSRVGPRPLSHTVPVSPPSYPLLRGSPKLVFRLPCGENEEVPHKVRTPGLSLTNPQFKTSHAHTAGPSSNTTKEKQVLEDGSGNPLRTVVLKLERSLESPPGLVNMGG